MTASAVHVRAAVEADVPLIHAFIHELADYERLAHEVTITEERLRQTLFGPRPAAEVLIASCEDAPAGYAVFFQNYSTFSARSGLYLEDIFVRPAFRGRGIGRALLARLATIARERRCDRLQWIVLDWNEPAIDFYKSLGAREMSDWRLYELTGQALEKLGE